MKQMEITFKSELEAIPNLRGMIASLISNKNQTISFINEVKTIVSEGITNAIIHGYNENKKDNENNVRKYILVVAPVTTPTVVREQCSYVYM